MTIKAIETKYGGCKFRSRLEARWAVFFDHLGIAWEYEPQGYEVTYRLACSSDTFNYLPDFWLPELKVWAEIKGELDAMSTDRLLNAAASLSSGDGGGCGGGHDLAVFGPVTSSGAVGLPVLLHMHKGDLDAGCLWCGRHDPRRWTIANDADPVDLTIGTRLLRGFYCPHHSSDQRIIEAIDAARTARFEFGQTRRKNVGVVIP